MADGRHRPLAVNGNKAITPTLRLRRALIDTNPTATRAARNSRQPVIGVITHNGSLQRLGINKNAARPIFNLCL